LSAWSAEVGNSSLDKKAGAIKKDFIAVKFVL
jgi:hypothetical protein